MRLPRREQLAGPADVALRIGRVGPDRQGDEVVLQVAMVIGCVRLAYPAVGAVELGKDDDGERRRHLSGVLDGGRDHLVVEAIRQPCFPVVQPSGRQRGVEHRLHGDVGDRGHRVGDWGPEAPQRGEQALARVERPHIAGDQRDDQVAVRPGQDAGPGLQLVGLGGGELAVEPQDLRRPREGMEDHAAQHRAHRVQAVLERGHHPEVVPGTADGPEQVLVLGRAGGAQDPVGGHDVYGEQVVDGKAVLAAQPALPPAEGQPGDAGRRDGAHRRRQAEGLRLAVELAPEHARLGTDRPGDGIDADALHARQVEHQAAVTDGLAGDVMPTAPYRDEQVVLACELHRGDDIGRAGAAGDQRRPVVDQRVPDGAGLVVAGIASA